MTLHTVFPSHPFQQMASLGTLISGALKVFVSNSLVLATQHSPSTGDEVDGDPAELPVEPDLGPVPPLPHPEDPGVSQPAI